MSTQSYLYRKVTLLRDLKADFRDEVIKAGTEATIVEQLDDETFILEVPSANIQTLEAKISDFELG